MLCKIKSLALAANAFALERLPFFSIAQNFSRNGRSSLARHIGHSWLVVMMRSSFEILSHIFWA